MFVPCMYEDRPELMPRFLVGFQKTFDRHKGLRPPINRRHLTLYVHGTYDRLACSFRRFFRGQKNGKLMLGEDGRERLAQLRAIRQARHPA